MDICLSSHTQLYLFFYRRHANCLQLCFELASHYNTLKSMAGQEEIEMEQRPLNKHVREQFLSGI